MNKVMSIILLLSFINLAQAEQIPFFEQKLQFFEKQDKLQPVPKNSILFVGSSSFAGWGSLQADMQPLTVINRGIGGSTMLQLVDYFDRLVQPYEPKKIVVYEGDNDIAYGHTPQQFLNHCQQFVSKVEQAFSQTRVYFVSVKRSIVRAHLWEKMQQANRLVKQFASQQELVEFIDINKVMQDENGKLRTDIFKMDGLHLNQQGYALWAATIRHNIIE